MFVKNKYGMATIYSKYVSAIAVASLCHKYLVEKKQRAQPMANFFLRFVKPLGLPCSPPNLTGYQFMNTTRLDCCDVLV